MNSSLQLLEAFCSLQGEAAEVGEPHLFLRLAGCPLRCSYCDTPESWNVVEDWLLHLKAEHHSFPNPVTAEELTKQLKRLALDWNWTAEESTLSITGGEPLAQAEALRDWLPTWPGRVVLETGGLWPEKLQSLLPSLDAVSLDWKLPSTLRDSEESVAPQSCVQVLKQSALPFWVKMVVTGEVSECELDSALQELAQLAPRCSTFLMPATPGPSRPASLGPDFLLDAQIRNRCLGLKMQVLPQIHPILGVR
ncbi:MAG: 7-carboxy-7-deazaguanine synthase QueE [Planctomycetota bacterium]|jgi:organic radical activating enzyme|nr:7-carboxy-7-deazaguanine synthase QueE [Planctomycetota bacterium]